jgi:hypothetical protein
MEHEYIPPKRPADSDKPKTPTTPEKAGLFRSNILRLITGEQPAEQPAPSERAPQPSKPETAPPKIKIEDQPEYERAGRVRRFARTVLRTVMAEATAESARPKPLDTLPLTEAAEDLREATDELGETMQDVREKPAEVAGFEFAPPVAPHRIFEDVVAERITERMQRLETEAEKTRTVSVLAAGLGIVAVLVAGHQYLARRSHKALGREFAAQKAVVAEQGSALANQRAEFNQLRAGQTANMARDRRHNYYAKLGEFTHHQAGVTREAARELQEAAERPRLTWMRERPAAAEIATPEQKSAPLVRVETADTIERLPSQAASAMNGVKAGIAAVHQTGVMQPADDTKPPLNPAAMRQEAARKARAAQLASTAWLYGAALAVIMLAVATFMWLG